MVKMTFLMMMHSHADEITHYSMQLISLKTYITIFAIVSITIKLTGQK